MIAIDIVAGIGFCVLIVLVAVLVLKLIDWLTLGRAWSPSERRSREGELDIRLLRPQFSELQVYFDTPIPDELRWLYADTRLILRRDIYFREPNQIDEHFIQNFLPADKRSVEDVWGRREMRFPFACDDFGNCFFVPMISRVSDACPVFYIDCEDCEDGKALRVADSLREFLSWETDEPLQTRTS